jgi:hypothetical protein
VSCASPTACTAVDGWIVGYHIALTDTPGSIVRWNGKQWSDQMSAGNNPPRGPLNAVSCASTTVCTAVGTYNKNRDYHTLAMRWTGG